MAEHDRNLRLLDFHRRSQGHPGGVYYHKETNQAYLPIHPFADEPLHLAKLDLKPDQCCSVDAYWLVGDDVCLLQVWLSQDDPLRRRGLFARWDDREPPMLHVVAVVDGEAITRKVFEALMIQFLSMGIPSDPRFNPAIGTCLVQLTS